ncbi:MAG: Ig-like domain-containing protein [Candidatus Aenigmatarchaeota archaeon]
MKISLAIFVFSIFIFSNLVSATPFLHDPNPENNSFISGGIRTFSINITSENLNSSSVRLYIISLNAYQQGENWDVHSLTCVNTSNEWKCSKSISFAIAGSDTIELFYFEANDTDDTKGNNGTVSNPLRFTLDRNPPTIAFVNPINNSYVSGNVTIRVTVTDTSSGVNNNTVQYSTDASTWNSLRNVSVDSFEAIWDTTTFANNQSVVLYARASDNVGNNFTSWINVTVDNEIPRLDILSNLTGILGGNVQLEVNVSDGYSGVDLDSVRYSVDGLNGALGCTGSNYSATCSAVINTVNLQDGNHTLSVTVTDRAGNQNSSSIQIRTSNTRPAISILEPANNAFIKGIVLVKTSVVNAVGLVTSVELSFDGITNNMTCNLNFTSCNYSINTSSLADGGHTIKVKAVNVQNLDITSGIVVTIDNTNPVITITHPVSSVKDDFEIKADVIDGNLNQKKVTFTLSSFAGNLSCTPQTPSRFICSTFFDSKKLNDGVYKLTVSAEDKAGNVATESKEITIANLAQIVEQPTGGQMPITEQNETEKREISGRGQKGFLGISLPFKSENIVLGVVVIAVFMIVLILAIVVNQKLKKSIIREG